MGREAAQKCWFYIEGPWLAGSRPRVWWRRRCKRNAERGSRYCWQHRVIVRDQEPYRA